MKESWKSVVREGGVGVEETMNERGRDHPPEWNKQTAVSYGDYAPNSCLLAQKVAFSCHAMAITTAKHTPLVLKRESKP